MEFTQPQNIKQPKGGLILEEKDERDHILGATIPWPVINESGQWREFVPVPELQRNKFGDVYGCVSFSYNNVHEFLHKKLYGTEINKSDRYIVVGSGTTPNQGNSKRTVAEWGRKNGWVVEERWPFNPEMTIKEYYNNGKVPQELLEEGKKQSTQYEMGYQWLPDNSINSIMDGLRYSPVQVDVERYAFNKNGHIINSGGGYMHEVIIFGRQSVDVDGKGENYFEGWDSENKQYIKFDLGYHFGSPMIHSLKKKNMVKIYKLKGEENKALYFLNPKDQKLVSFSDGVITGGELFKTLFVEYFFEEVDKLPYPIADYKMTTQLN